MQTEALRQIIIDQQESYIPSMFSARHYKLETNLNYCFVGIRRAGKSFLLYQLISETISNGTKRQNTFYLNFEDERMLEFGPTDFNKIVQIAHTLCEENEKPHFFFDEIQNINGWEKFVRRMADTHYHINITGSNSKMLSKEIATTLGGRFMIQMVLPYSFEEYLSANHILMNKPAALTTAQKAKITRLFDKYIQFGAFPELVNIADKKNYLSSIYHTIYLGDIIARNNINNDFAIRLIIRKIAESTMQPISYSRLTNIVKSTGASVSKQTVINYVNYALDSFLIFDVPNFASKIAEKTSKPKYYLMDTGLLGILAIDVTTAQLENLVAIELVRRFGMQNIFYYQDKVEVDFYIPENSLAIQVCYDGLENAETRDRELKALYKLSQRFGKTKCMIITNSHEENVEYNGLEVEVVPCWKWLLNG